MEGEIKKLLQKTERIVEESGVKDYYRSSAFSAIFNFLSQSNVEVREKIKSQYKSAQLKTDSKNTKPGGLVGNIRQLIDLDFFDTSKTPVQVSQELKRKALNYTNSAISVALMRLTRAGILVRDGQGTAKDPWCYKSKEHE